MDTVLESYMYGIKNIYALLKGKETINAPVICNHVPQSTVILPSMCPGSAVDMPTFDSHQNSGGNTGAFLPGYSEVCSQDMCQDLKYCEMRDFNMAERQQIESMLKKCFNLAVYVI